MSIRPTRRTISRRRSRKTQLEGQISTPQRGILSALNISMIRLLTVKSVTGGQSAKPPGELEVREPCITASVPQGAAVEAVRTILPLHHPLPLPLQSQPASFLLVQES